MTPERKDALIEIVAIVSTVVLFGALAGVLGFIVINYRPE